MVLKTGNQKPTIIVFDNAYNEMTPPGGSIGVNTTPGATYITPVTIVITITFPMGTYTSADLDIANFNPFLIVNQNRGVEVHLPNYQPTDLVDESLLELQMMIVIQLLKSIIKQKITFHG